MPRALLRALFGIGQTPTPVSGGRLGAATTIIKRSDGVDYLVDLLGQIDLKLVRMHEAQDADQPCFYIRHDVDQDMDRALAIAEAECRHGYFSTWFLLTPGSYGEKRNYYGTLTNGAIQHAPHLVDHCKRLLDLGHDLGFHNDLVALALATKRSPADLLTDEIEFFTGHGIRLVGTASHGSPLARQLKYNNRELFAGCIRRGWVPGRTIEHDAQSIQLHSLRLEDYGFRYEAYSLPRDSRLSESGRVWGGRIAGRRVPKEQLSQHFDIDQFRALVSRASAANGIKALSILTHPCHWDSR